MEEADEADEEDDEVKEEEEEGEEEEEKEVDFRVLNPRVSCFNLYNEVDLKHSQASVLEEFCIFERFGIL